MNLTQFQQTCIKTIRANFRVRNAVVFPNSPNRQRHLRKQRGDLIRDWIACYRLATDPAAPQEKIAQLVSRRLA